MKKLIYLSLLAILSFGGYAQNPTFYFNQLDNIPLGGHAPQAITTCDYNSDGLQDLAVTTDNGIALFLGLNTNQYSFSEHYNTGITPTGLLFMDALSGGSSVHIVVANKGSNTITILTQNGSVVAPTMSIQATYTVGLAPKSVTGGDFNGDGFLDIAVANSGSNNISVLYGNGSGFLGAPINIPVGLSPCSITSGKFNSDGIADLAVANTNSNNVSILIGSTSGFGAPTNLMVGTNPLSLCVNDFNTDGLSDLAVANSISNNVSILMNSTSGFLPASSINGTIGARSITSGFFYSTLNVKPDIAVVNSNLSISVLQNNGNGSFSQPINYPAPDDPMAITSDGVNVGNPWLEGSGIINHNLVTANPKSFNISFYHHYLNQSTVVLKSYIEGFYNTGTGLMNRPLMETFYPNNLLQTPVATDLCDIGSAELHHPTFPYALVNVNSWNPVHFSISGRSFVKFNSIYNGSYYLAVKTRNGVETWSAAPITLGPSPVVYDFTTSASQAYGSNQTLIPGTNIYAIYSGDINQDGAVEVSDYAIWQYDSNNFVTGYINSDLNGDLAADVSDYSIWEANAINFISALTP